jgi:predicted Ser/Thr protein kinase
LKKKTEKNADEQKTAIDFRRPVIPEWDQTIRQPIQVGSTLNNRFVLEELIAKGGMGVVYKAKDLRKVETMDRNPYIAIKVLTEDFKQHPESWIALQREARKSQQLAHPNIITVYDFDRDGSNVFMTMELLKGEPLTALLERVHGSGLPFKKAIPLIKGMAEALTYAHQRGIVHSDFKPGNVFITHDNVVKVLDFGIARAIISPGKREDKTVFDPGSLGALTPAYASLEMLTNELPDSRDDIYALACVTYELLTGEHPFNKKTAVEALANHLQVKRIKHLNRKQCKGLMTGLAFRRKDRTSTVELFLNGLQYRNSSKIYMIIFFLTMIALLVSTGYYGYQFLNRQQWEQRIEALEAFVQEGPLSMEQTTEAAIRLQEMDKLVGENARLEKLRDDLALNYLNLVKTAQENQQWQEAKDTLVLAQELEPNKHVLELLRSRLYEINNQQNLFLSIFDLETRFDAELLQMQAEPDSTRKVLSILNQLAILAPHHPLIKDGRIRIADTQAVAVRKFGQQQQWQDGLQLADDLLLLLPSSTALLQARKELDKVYQAKLSEDEKIKAEKQARQRSTDLRKARQRVESLLGNPETTTAWRDKVKRQLGRLKKRLPRNDPWLAEMQASFTSINAKQQSLKWKGAIKSKGAEQTD